MDELMILIKGAGELGIEIDEKKVRQFRIYQQLLEKWNRRINLMRYGSSEELYRSHFLDSLWCSAPGFFKRGALAVDIGSGAGLPGIPLKICFPGVDMHLLESQQKRVGFLNQVIGELELDGCQVIAGRAESIGRSEEYRGYYDIAVSRAVASLPVLVELSLPLLKRCGVMVALKGRKAEEEIKQAEYAIEKLGGELLGTWKYHFEGEEGRSVVVVKKVMETPDEFPRREGIPEKRPLIKKR